MSSVEKKKKKGCNCKKGEQLESTVKFLKKYGAYEDAAGADGTVPLKYKMSSVLMTVICVILVPFLFIHIVVSAIYNRIVHGKGYVDNSLIFRIMKNHKN